ncbi:MAG: PEP-CTERM sorting domain-containing protein [Hyphomicrobiales bacterium]|nr:PEP-CTERM sorting domain-containing protein [Hyphomicrobiales bacterium]MBV8224076.1 PEP-CTERM sorting domain-containing protein [Verrucomicrobiota bacterium]
MWVPESQPSVPESSTWAMMLLGFTGLGYVRHHTRRQERDLCRTLSSPPRRGSPLA